MNIKHLDIKIPKENPFENCKLGRKQHADVLTNVVNSYSEGFVLAINNKWGTGKTTFVKMWKQELENKGYKTVYFNAWENDFEDNPLTALMGELKTLTSESTEPKFKKTLKKAATISKHLLPLLAKAVADKYLETDNIKEAMVGLSKGLSDIFENEVKEYAQKKKGIEDFKDSLSEFVSDTSEEKPLVFIVDELDRCRPNYAVSILEQIKHFFSVPNIVFVLSIDKEQLGNAVKGVYGSDSIDSEEYLRRFIDLEYSIPDPRNDDFINYLFDYYDFADFFDADERRGPSPELRSDRKHFLTIAGVLFHYKSMPLRQQEKIFGLARVALRCFGMREYVVPHIFLFLAYLKVTHTEFYRKLKTKEFTLSEVQQEFLAIVKANMHEETEYELLVLEAYLVNFYNNYMDKGRNNGERLYEYNDEGKIELKIDSIIDKEQNSQFLNILQYMNSGRREGNLDLGHFIDKIELFHNLKT